MTEELKIEELLNSFIDGELSIRQRTEVKRMAANDPKIAGRLRQLQKCRTLVSALPVAKAPSYVMDHIKASLEAKALENEKTTVSISDYRHERTGLFLFRRVLAAAAVLTMAVVLVAVINMLVPPQTSGPINIPTASMRFSGKLELKSNDFKAVDSMVSRAIEDSGLAKSVISDKEANRRIYTLNCSREGLNKLLNKLNVNWDKLYSAELFVETETFNEYVEIKAVTPSQVAAIVNQANTDQSIQTARNIAIINSVNELLQDRNVTSPDRVLQHGLFTIPQPVEAKYNPPANQDNGRKTVQLRIILSR